MAQPHLALKKASECLKQLPVDAFELFLSRSESLKIEIKSQTIDVIQKSADVGIAVRVDRGARIGFSFTTALDDDSIRKMCESATALAEIAEPDEEARLRPLEQGAKAIHKYDPSIERLPLEERIELTRLLESSCLGADPRVKQTRSASTRYALYESELLDQSGNHLHHRGTHFQASISCKADSPQGDSQMGGEAQGSWQFKDLDVKGVGVRAAHFATELLGAGTTVSARVPAVLRNSVVIELLDFLSSSFSAEEVFKGRSLLGGKTGSRIFSPLLTLSDKADSPDGEYTSPFDGEGSLTRTTPLVTAGVLNTYLTDREYARKMKLSETGSAHRSLKSQPSIGTSDLRLDPGTTSYEGLIRAAGNGVLITDLLGLHTANSITGDFSVGASGILIENGALTRPIKGFAVSGNILSLLDRVAQVGSDTIRYGSNSAPSLLVEELTVGGNA